MNKTLITLGLVGAILGLDACSQKDASIDSLTIANKVNIEHSSSYNPRDDKMVSDEKIVDFVRNSPDVTGFGGVAKNIEKRSWHSFYRTGDGHYVARLGSLIYLFDENGKLMTHGSHKIVKDNDKIYLNTGSLVVENEVPKSLDQIANRFGSPEGDRLEEERDVWRARLMETGEGLYLR